MDILHSGHELPAFGGMKWIATFGGMKWIATAAW